jgi:carbon storage regulator
MLVLSRKPGEKVIIGDGITLTIEEVRGNRIRISIAAPDQVRILRGEIVGREDKPLQWQVESSDPVVSPKG